MSDLISRKEAIEKIESHTRVGDELYPLTDTDKILNHAFEIAASCVYNLPSAQSEIIRCKDCKHFEYDHPYIIQGIPVLGHEVCNAWGDGCKTDENGYCFMAERRAYERTD